MNSSKYLVVALLAMLSGALLTFSSNIFFHENQIFIIFLGGSVPLITYWLSLRKVQKAGRNNDGIDFHLTDIEVDSVYYLGFLITLATLVISILTAHLGGKVEPFMVVGQFTLGLVATGFALWARLDLQQRNEEYSDPDRLVDDYINKMEKVVHELDLSYTNLQNVFNFASKSFEDSTIAYVDSTNSIQKVNAKVAKASDSLIKKVEASALNLLDTSSSLIKINTEMAAVSGSLNEGLDSVNLKSVSVSEALDALKMLTDNFKTIELVVNNFSASLQQLNKVDIGDIVTSIETSAGTIATSTKQFEQEIIKSANNISSNDSLSILVGNVNTIEVIINNFSLALQNLNKVDLTHVVTSLDTSAGIIGASASNFEQELTSSATKISSNSNKFTDDLDKSTQQLSDSLTSLSDAMVDVANKVADQLKGH